MNRMVRLFLLCVFSLPVAIVGQFVAAAPQQSPAVAEVSVTRVLTDASSPALDAYIPLYLHGGSSKGISASTPLPLLTPIP